MTRRSLPGATTKARAVCPGLRASCVSLVEGYSAFVTLSDPLLNASAIPPTAPKTSLIS